MWRKSVYLTSSNALTNITLLLWMANYFHYPARNAQPFVVCPIERTKRTGFSAVSAFTKCATIAITVQAATKCKLSSLTSSCRCKCAVLKSLSAQVVAMRFQKSFGYVRRLLQLELKHVQTRHSYVKNVLEQEPHFPHQRIKSKKK